MKRYLITHPELGEFDQFANNGMPRFTPTGSGRLFLIKANAIAIMTIFPRTTREQCEVRKVEV